MRISGKDVADKLKVELKERIEQLNKRGITPKVAIITVGAEGAWETYVRNKLKTAGELGIEAVLIPLADAGQDALLRKINEINEDPSFHGMIVQRPMPENINKQTITNAIKNEKDIDGFREDSKFKVPVWLATERLLEESFEQLGIDKPWTDFKFVILGKGETAGAPAIKELSERGISVSVIDSKTQNPDEIIKGADVVISSVGKPGVINAGNLKKGAILIGVGTHTEEGKLKGDYNEQEIENIAASYTPTPGGVGPVNLSFLFSNLIEAAEASE